MKKIFAFIIAVCLILAPIVTVNTVKAEEVKNYIASEAIDNLIKEICDGLKDRTSFTDAIGLAAEKLASYLSESENLNVDIQHFKKTVTLPQGLAYVTKELESDNIVASVKNFDSNKKTILITTNFANHYSDNDFGKGVKAEGALGTAATTALTIELAKYLASLENPEYNYKFALFSGTDEGNFGSEAYKDKYLDGDVILVINLERLGCGYTYYYTDEVRTAHGDFIKTVASRAGYKEFPTVGRVLLDYSTVDDLPYSHYAMRGDISTFLSAGKSCLELIGGEFNGLGDSERSSVYVTNTSKDTYEALVKNHIAYADKLSNAGQFVINLTSKAELKDVCLGAATSYKIFTKGWIAYVICLGIIVILILIMILVLQSFEKKYPLPTAPKVKIAVFGKEFEDFKENEIVVDIKHNEKTNDNDVNPFDV
ncbi:MAG: M28 family peptidase [Clostridiales bacterium]|nr:M28 family peptidase [Clostridiales bacterium]